MSMIKERQDGFGDVLASMRLREAVKTDESGLQKKIIVSVPRYPVRRYGEIWQ